MEYSAPFVLLVLFAAAAFSEVVKFKGCPGENESVNCEISQLRVEPCAEAASKKPCNLVKGKKYEIEFDYVGVANLEGLTTKAYWASAAADLPLIGMDEDGCAHTTCPTTDKNSTFKYSLEMSPSFPVGNYPVKWKLFKDNEMDCCLIFKIKLVSK